MFNKTISSLLVFSMLHTNVAFCMEGTNADDERPKSPSLSLSTKIEEDVEKSPQALLEKYKSLSKEDFVAELKSNPDGRYALGGAGRELDLLIYPLLEDKNIFLSDRFFLLGLGYNSPPVGTLKILLKDAGEQSFEVSGIQIAYSIRYADVPDIESQKERDRIIVSVLDKETVPLHERLGLLLYLEEAPPAATLKQLLREVTEQSVELSGYQISSFIKFANNDPEVIESVKPLLKTPEMVGEAARYLSGDTIAPLVDLILAVARDESRPQEMRVAALRRILWGDIKIDEESRKERDRIIVSLLDKETVPLTERLELLRVLQEAPSAATLKQLLREVTEQSVELSGYQISFFIKFANNDPEVIEGAKALLKTPGEVLEVAQYLSGDIMLLLVDLLLEVARNEGQPQERRVSALRRTLWINIKDDDGKERDRLIVSFLDKETVPLTERLELLRALQEAPPVETLIKLAEALEPEQASKVIAEGGTLEPLLDHLTESSHPLIKETLERYFFENPKEFFDNYKGWLREHLQEVEGSKKELILEAVFKLIQPTPNSIKTKSAKFILKFGANEKYRDKTLDVLSAFVKTGEEEQYKEKSDACRLILKYSEDLGSVKKNYLNQISIATMFKKAM